ICASSAHIAVDECGAPERFTGSKLIEVPTEDGKLTPELIRAQMHGIGDEHHVQPRVVSITQSTELGTLYSVGELGDIWKRLTNWICSCTSTELEFRTPPLHSTARWAI